MGQKIKTYAFYAFILSAVIGISAGIGVAAVVAYQVLWGDDSELTKSTILARIQEQTTIYMLDETTKVGSFFDESHRSYIPIEEVPAHMIRAMVASEDKHFFSHVGIDPVAISKAFIDGLINGFRFRRGGSTITQQTVKNIMDRREHTFQRKFKEMIRALQLERIYDKQQILEFYLNQFHVTANGKGIGIAAQYYFSKSVQDLDLVEAAFIAGSVKAPSKYNPFIKYSIEEREKAWLEANQRKNYVLRRMYEQGWISEEELKEAWDRQVPFKKGEFRTKEVALVSLIRGQLNKKEILDALGMDSPSQLNHAGLRIYTTLDAELQSRAQLAMRRNLSRLESILKGFKVEDVEKYKPLRSLNVNQFYYGKVEKVQKGKNPEILLDFGLPKGKISGESIRRAAKILNLPTYQGENFHVKQILDETKPGDILFVEVVDYDPQTLEATLELRKRPDVNGGLVAIDKGEVRAVVAGFDNLGFNRAMFATRQPGSVFKPVIFLAGLQLGWTIVDRLDNERRVFPFQGDFYIPRPDHKSPYKDVSVLWSGVTSENLATVDLTYRLLEKLKFEEFKSLMGSMELLPEEGESARDYHYRVARAIGVQLDQSGIREFLLQRAVEDLRPDLIFSGSLDLMRQLQKLWFGRGYQSALQEVYALTEEDVSNSEKNLRIRLLKRNYQRLEVLADVLSQDWDRLSELVPDLGPERVLSDPQYASMISRFRVMSTAGGRPSLAYIRDLPGEEFVPTDDQQSLALEPQPGRALNPLDMQAIWGGFDGFGAVDISLNEVLLDGFLPVKYLERIESRIDSRFEKVMAEKSQHSLYQYFHHHDFRISLGLHYMKQLVKAMGVYSKVEPVLSFGLGTNDLSVAEVAKIYQTFTNGKIYRFYEEGPQNQLNLIRRIEDRDGNVLYEPKREEFELTDVCYASQMSEILEKVVTHGTGRRARGELYVDLTELATAESVTNTKIRVPAFGKTGTTNDYTTAYFAGYLPYPAKQGEPLDPIEHSMAIASYVGYDLNDTMRRGAYRISGAAGALPIWSDFAKSVIQVRDYAEYIDKFDIATLSRKVWPMASASCTGRVRVDLPRGTVLVETREDGESFGFTNIERDGEVAVNEFARNKTVVSPVHLAMNRQSARLQPMRAFQPFKKQEQTDMDIQVITGKPEWDDEPAALSSLSESPRPSSTPSANVVDQEPKQEASLPVQAPLAPRAEPETEAPAAPDFIETEGFEDEDLW